MATTDTLSGRVTLDNILNTLDTRLGTEITQGKGEKGEFLDRADNIDITVYTVLRRLSLANSDPSESMYLFREILMQRPNLVKYVYTPAVSEMFCRQEGIKTVQANDGNYLLPSWTLPLRLSIDDIFSQDSEEKAVDFIKTEISHYMSQRYSHFEGIFEDSGNDPAKNIISVITDSERVLGDKDQGQGGEISQGKLALYFLSGVFDPKTLCPIQIDVGTNNASKKVKEDIWYDGIRDFRATGEVYDLAMKLVGKAVGGMNFSLFQVEDYITPNAMKTLRQWRDSDYMKGIPLFDDDVEGTASLFVAGLISAEKTQDVDLSKSYYLFHGAGAGSGLAEQTAHLLVDKKGMDEYDALSRMIMTDSAGLMYSGRTVKKKRGQEEWADYQEKYVVGIRGTDSKKEEAVLKSLYSFMEEKESGWRVGDNIEIRYAAEFFGTNILAGLCGGNTEFTPEVLGPIRESINKKDSDEEKAMVVFGMSNPTGKCELVYVDGRNIEYVEGGDQKAAEKHIEGIKNDQAELKDFLVSRLTQTIDVTVTNENDRIIFATGSPFPSFEYKEKEYDVTIANNQFVFPGLGAAAALTGAEVNMGMFYAASEGVAACVEPGDGLYPSVSKFQEVNMSVIVYSVKEAISQAKAKGISEMKNGFEEYYAAIDSNDLDVQKAVYRSIESYVQELMWINSDEVKNKGFESGSYNSSILDYAFGFDPAKLCERVADMDAVRGGKAGDIVKPTPEQAVLRNNGLIEEHGLERKYDLKPVQMTR